MWTKFDVRWRFLTRLCASVPADPSLVKKWIDARKPRARPPGGKSIDEIAEEVLETTEEAPEQSLLVFQRIEGALVMRAATIRAHLKDCARVLSSYYVGKIAGERTFSSKVLNGVYLPPELYWIPILRADTGKPVAAHDGERDKAIHVSTPQGQRSALKTFQYVENAMLRFPLLVLSASSGKPLVGESDLEHLFNYGGVHGYAGERSDGEGRYIAEFHRVED